ncbi:adenylate/guanylate cyclase domain-containing protein [Agrobacterium sp. MOPV5]|uniref:adenylate/guanylate cyclase domain-containing protein n=1 Tax=Agrobacterium leguminum TaxID=2792015 RepID=UPI0018C2E91E|nr:adenylate/guanylate cyclase domain-containing protein [Agrobacterium leguminum]MBG0511622.1 adenylate/guanylate cyclase domain-containing protein [Agrobacterium leguminum]
MAPNEGSDVTTQYSIGATQGHTYAHPSPIGQNSREDSFRSNQPDDLLCWLMSGTQDEPFIDNILAELCERLRAAAVPVARATLHFRTHNPQWLGARLLWRAGSSGVKVTTFGYGVEETPQFLQSPAYDIYSGATMVRQRLDVGIDSAAQYPIYTELTREGLTDYVAWPLNHTLGKRHVVTFATDRSGGFLDDHIETLRYLLSAITLITEIRLKNILTRTLLDTYVGPRAGQEILAGATRRGSGKTVNAAVTICDLRDFTEFASRWPLDDVIERLNQYFDAISEPIERFGGEILKFVGDGLLAIFPLSDPNASQNLLAAVREGHAAIAALNATNSDGRRPPLRHGVGVHVGEVAYGNIGSKKRLDFTVIGPAVNVASRLEGMTKKLNKPILLSGQFAKIVNCQDELDHIGSFNVRGLDNALEVYSLVLGGRLDNVERFKKNHESGE